MIIIRRNYKEGIYEVKFTAEDAVKVRELFYTDVLPTPFSLDTPVKIVRSAIAKQNKQSIITLEV